MNNYFDYGFDIKNRYIFLCSDVNESEISRITKALFLLKNKSMEDTITLILSSYGGDVCETLGLYDILKTVPKLRTVAIGKCQSAAPLLISVGTPGLRYASPNCLFMIHDLWVDGQMDSSVQAASMEIKNSKQLRNRFLELLAKNTKKTEKEWSKIIKKPGDTCFFPENAIEYGVIDKIWEGNF